MITVSLHWTCEVDWLCHKSSVTSLQLFHSYTAAVLHTHCSVPSASKGVEVKMKFSQESFIFLKMVQDFCIIWEYLSFLH